MKLTDLDAYEVLEQCPLRDLKSEGLVLRHKKSGARIAVISNDDDNKVFYIGFRTPAEDSTGVPHIIEHTVLCGSENSIRIFINIRRFLNRKAGIMSLRAKMRRLRSTVLYIMK